jgi:hypothetical protein
LKESNLKVMINDDRFFYRYKITNIEDDELLAHMESEKI